MTQIDRQISVPATVFALKAFHCKAASACEHVMCTPAAPHSANASPFHIINGVAYPRDGLFCIECVICELGVPFYAKGKARHYDREATVTFMQAHSRQ